METRILGRVLALLATICALAMAQGVAAGPRAGGGFPAGSVCHASADAGEDYTALARKPQRWICQPHDWSIGAQQALLRFDYGAKGVSGAGAPIIFTTDLTRFSRLELSVIGADGRIARRSLSEADMVAGSSGWTMSATLPRLYGPVRAVVISVTGARHPRMLAGARLRHRCRKPARV